MFGSKRDELTRELRRLHNEELYDLYSSCYSGITVLGGPYPFPKFTIRLPTEYIFYGVGLSAPGTTLNLLDQSIPFYLSDHL
jgi:hypothetical protein